MGKTNNNEVTAIEGLLGVWVRWGFGSAANVALPVAPWPSTLERSRLRLLIFRSLGEARMLRTTSLAIASSMLRARASRFAHTRNYSICILCESLQHRLPAPQF